MPDRLERSHSVHATPTGTSTAVLDGAWLFGPALLGFGAAPRLPGRHRPPFAGLAAASQPHVARTHTEPLTLAWAPASDEPMPMRGVLLGVALGLMLWALLLAPVLLWLA